MRFYLLLGAGFSRNWGGWLVSEAFEYLLGAPELADRGALRTRLWKNQEALWRGDENGGFENALAEVQLEFKRDPRNAEADLAAFQSALASMFRDMNAGLGRTPFEFQQDVHYQVSPFLTRFDAIFTLNQDLLLDRSYLPISSASGPRRWSGAFLPGMDRMAANEVTTADDGWAKDRWSPSRDYKLDGTAQPVYKLHGASNWWTSEGQPMLIMGGQKAAELRLYPVLDRYYKEFVDALSSGESRLMVIGYGFRDAHVNDAIFNSISTNRLKLFVIDPLGSDLAMAANATRHRNQITAPTRQEEAFIAGLIGASRRPLTTIFGGDRVEHEKIMRFFA